VPILLFTMCGTILTWLTTFSCNFLEIDIGFEPSNNEWGEAKLSIGPWYYKTGANEELSGAEGLNSFIDGFRRDSCSGYTDELKSSFIDSDSVWQFARVSLLIGGISALVATVIITMVVFCSLPVCFIWTGVLLPSVVLALAVSAVTFMMVDIDICNSRFWEPAGPEYTPTVAKSCSLGESAFILIGGLACFLIALSLIIYDVPIRRALDPEYNADKSEMNELDVEDDESSSFDVEDVYEPELYEEKLPMEYVDIKEEMISDEEKSLELEQLPGRSLLNAEDFDDSTKTSTVESLNIENITKDLPNVFPTKAEATYEATPNTGMLQNAEDEEEVKNERAGKTMDPRSSLVMIIDNITRNVLASSCDSHTDNVAEDIMDISSDDNENGLNKIEPGSTELKYSPNQSTFVSTGKTGGSKAKQATATPRRSSPGRSGASQKSKSSRGRSVKSGASKYSFSPSSSKGRSKKRATN